MLGGIGKDTVQAAVAGIDKQQDELREQTIPAVEQAAQAVVNNLAGQLQAAAGAIALAAGALPEQIVSALDGLTITVSPITIKVERSHV